jgi:uncharacterized membrane protein YdbT with pleckstrin-like domain
MSYLQRSLGAGETIITRARFHWLYSLAAWLWLLIPGIALLAAWIWARQQGADTAGGPALYEVGLVGLVFLVGLFVFAKMMILKWTTEIGVTSHRFVEKRGLLSLRSNEIALPNIEGVQVKQSILGRIFGYGTVRIEGTGIDSVTTPTIADPVGFVRAIQTAKEHLVAKV